MTRHDELRNNHTCCEDEEESFNIVCSIVEKHCKQLAVQHEVSVLGAAYVRVFCFQ